MLSALTLGRTGARLLLKHADVPSGPETFRQDMAGLFVIYGFLCVVALVVSFLCCGKEEAPSGEIAA